MWKAYFLLKYAYKVKTQIKGMKLKDFINEDVKMKNIKLQQDEKFIKTALAKLYGTDNVERIYSVVQSLIDQFCEKNCVKESKALFSKNDAVLITYADSIRLANQKSLNALASFLNEYVGESIDKVHLLPFYPYSSDDGFSVIDYYKVNPEVGDWEEICQLSNEYDLMFDAVLYKAHGYKSI
ncbi:MAG: hypothetical protein KAX49_16555 [Halanaerobiales bacterium]|nr:hypothetical protein [Halanaerobiales bacterium]